ncbi:MAG: glutamine--fructose-6-phosphate transaminase (isomerizing) [Candidatus Ancillula sp.]|jgi:glucosamine--fructose-6-phosphate aminotransferase (isomerizing)|nr:glutamine--fructose-6-phosphate transaminase (isomerizing) [Candidatus Ancillula sp.]
MCGIVGYVRSIDDPNNKPLEVCLHGLKRLEYRGYDSAGVALAGFSSSSTDLESTQTIPGLKVQVRKKAGRLDNLKLDIEQHPTLPASCAIAHTRWATHGKPTDANAHPHVSNDSRLALIHNGIIENAGSIRAKLEADGVFFTSNTDTEVAVHLLRKTLDDSKDLTEAMQKVAKVFKGTFTLLAIDAMHPDVVVGARHDSPLVVGLGEGENFLGSDVAAFVEYTKQAIELGQDQVVTLTPTEVKITDFSGNAVEGKPYTIDWDASAASKGGYKTFMEKEIREEPRAVADTLLGRIDENSGRLKLDEVKTGEGFETIEDFEAAMRNIDKIIVVACGTAAYAGHVAKYAIEHWCRIPVEVELAHEFRYRDPIVNENSLVISISQSGETMDTLMAVRHAKEQKARTISICNTQGATIPRESDAVLYTHAGPEVAVASTKAFVAQITATYLIGLYLANVRRNKFMDEINDILSDLEQIPNKIQDLVDQFEVISKIAEEHKELKSVLFLGRHVGYPVALEGALKLKELAYIHAEGFAAGELKHGPIALIEEGQVVFVILPPVAQDELHSKVISNIKEIQARGARVIAIAETGDLAAQNNASLIIERPVCPTLMAPLLDVIPLQIFAYSLASAKGLDVDQPRNLAKSVTVE